MDCYSLQTQLASFALVKECDVGSDGSLRIATPFLYPDGSLIDVFYQTQNDFFLSARLTDLGQTTAFLADLHVYIDKNHEKREQILSDVCRTLGVQESNGELYVLIDQHTDLADAMIRLAQACVRISDVSYTHAFRNKTDFHATFAQYLGFVRPDRLEDFGLEGRFGRKIWIDFFVRQNGKPDNLILTLSSANRTSSHNVANDVFSKWYDLDRYKNDYQFLTVVDSDSKSLLKPDINRIADVSQVIRYPLERETLDIMLAR